MADEKQDKAQEEANKKEQEEAKKEVVSVCTLNLRQILVALHEKALSEVDGKFKSNGVDLTILNSAIEGAGGKDAKFYGAGLHIIAAIPKDNKGLDKNKVEKKDAIPALQAYVLWFVGPDLKDKVTENVLKPLEDGAEGKVADNHEKKEDIEKSKEDSVAGEKYNKESTIFIPSFNQYLLTEDGEEAKDDDKEKKTEDKNAEDAKDVKGTPGEGENSAQGWYVEYKMTIPGQKEHPVSDALKGFAKDLVKAFGIELGNAFAGSGTKHTVGDLIDSIDAVFGKMDASKFESEFNAEMKKRMKQTSAQAQVWDTKTILKYLKKEVARDKSKIAPVLYALCVRVDKNDKSYDLFNEDAIANITNAAISGAMRGIIKKLKFGVKAKDVILVNNYKDNKKAKDNEKFDTDKDEGAVRDNLITKKYGKLITESEENNILKEKDLLDVILENTFLHFNNKCIKHDNIKSLMRLMNIDESIIFEAKTGGKVSVERIVDFIKSKGAENILNTKDKYKSELDYVYNDDKFKATYLKGKKDMYKKEVLKCLDSIYAADSDDAMISATNKVLEDYKSGKGKGSAIILHAIYEVLDSLNIEDKKEDEEIEITFIDKDPNEKDDDKEIAKVKKEEGKDLEIPDPPKHAGYKFTGWDPDPEEMKESGETYSTYEDDENEEDEEIEITYMDIDDPSKQDDEKEYKEMEKKAKENDDDAKAPTPKDKEGWKFKNWEPDPDTMSKSGKTFAKYEEVDSDEPITITFREPKDPGKPVDLKNPKENTVIIGDPIPYNPDKKITPPKATDFTEKGYTFIGWKPDPETIEDPTGPIDIIALYLKNIKILFIYNNPERPNAKPEIIQEPKDLTPTKDLKKLLDLIKKLYPDPKSAKLPDGYAVNMQKPWSIMPDKLVKLLNNNNSIETDADNIVSISLNIYSQKDYIINIVDIDPEDPDNPKSYKDIAKIHVVGGAYTEDELKTRLKSEKKRSEPDEKKIELLTTAIKENSQSLKTVENISKFEADHKPYKFEGWNPPLEDIISGKVKLNKGEKEITMKAQYSNDIKAKHTDIDFYIVPMKGLKDKESKDSK